MHTNVALMDSCIQGGVMTGNHTGEMTSINNFKENVFKVSTYRLYLYCATVL